MFGQYNRNIDSKNRILLPSKLKESLGDVFYLTIGFDDIVEIRSQEEFQKLTETMVSQNQFSQSARLLKRHIFGNSQEITLDNQGRFVIPKQFLEKANIQKEVLFVGAGEYCEMWASEKYQEYQKSMSEFDIQKAANEIAQMDNK